MLLLVWGQSLPTKQARGVRISISLLIVKGLVKTISDLIEIMRDLILIVSDLVLIVSDLVLVKTRLEGFVTLVEARKFVGLKRE